MLEWQKFPALCPYQFVFRPCAPAGRNLGARAPASSMAPIVYACDLFVNFENLRLRMGEAMTFNIYTQINKVMFLAEVRVTCEVVAQHCYNGAMGFFVWLFSFFSEQWTEQTSGHILTLNRHGLA